MLNIFKVNTEKFKTDLNELEIIGLRVTANEYLNEQFEEMYGDTCPKYEHSTAYTSSSGFAMLNFMGNPVITVNGLDYEVSYACVLGESRVVLGAYLYNEENGELGNETVYISN